MGGVIAAANPLIGFTLLAKNWFGESEKDKQNKAFVENYANKWDEFELIIETLRQDVIEATENVAIYLTSKHEEILKGVVTMLKETAAAGHPINHYFKNIKDVELPKFIEMEKQFGL